MFTSNKTQLTEFPELKSDIPLFRLENGNYHVYRNFFCKTKFCKIDQLIAENPESSKQTFNLSHVTITSIATHWGGSQIKSIADQDCSAPYVGADLTEYQCLTCLLCSYLKTLSSLFDLLINE